MVSSSPLVRAYDLRKGLPYPDGTFDACYSSHVLEHFSRDEARALLQESWRVLRPGGAIRVVVPDLESIARNYLRFLDQLESGEAGSEESGYDWTMLELYDQTVRRVNGGEILPRVLNAKGKELDFIRSRIGAEATGIITEDQMRTSLPARVRSRGLAWLAQKIRSRAARVAVCLIAGHEAANSFDEGMFRNSGEIHRWMYDRFSLRRLLENIGFANVQVCNAGESRISRFTNYNLDVVDGAVRKPDSLFIEASKK